MGIEQHQQALPLRASLPLRRPVQVHITLVAQQFAAQHLALQGATGNARAFGDPGLRGRCRQFQARARQERITAAISKAVRVERITLGAGEDHSTIIGRRDVRGHLVAQACRRRQQIAAKPHVTVAKTLQLIVITRGRAEHPHVVPRTAPEEGHQGQARLALHRFDHRRALLLTILPEGFGARPLGQLLLQRPQGRALQRGSRALLRAG
ncbi:hypothetical protein D3C79_735090 [compost metagenome]